MAWLVLPVGSEDVIMYPSRQQKGPSTMELIVKQRFKKKKKWPTSVSEIEFLPIEGHFCVGVDTRGSLMRRTACAPLHKHKLSLPKQQFQHVGAAAWNSDSQQEPTKLVT